jgi:hypothetical protein
MANETLYPVFTDKRITRKVQVTRKHPTPHVVFRDGPMVPKSGDTRFVPGTKVRIFYKEGQSDDWFLIDESGVQETWVWENA